MGVAQQHFLVKEPSFVSIISERFTLMSLNVMNPLSLFYYYFFQVKYLYIYFWSHNQNKKISGSEIKVFFAPDQPILWIGIKSYPRNISSTPHFWKNEAGKITSDTHLCRLVSIPPPSSLHLHSPSSFLKCLLKQLAPYIVLGTKNRSRSQKVSDNTL